MGYPKWIKNKPDCLGVYVFHYNNGNNFTSAWLNTHVNKSFRPQYWAIRKAFTGKEPINNVTVINAFNLPETNVKSKTWVPITLNSSDIENDSLEVSFYYSQRTGSRRRRDQLNTLNHRGNITNGFEIEIPKEHGTLKIYAFVKDNYNNLGIASNSIRVEDQKAKQKKYLVPKVKLPFYVYKDNTDLPYVPTGYMGNYKDMDVDLNCKTEKYSGETSIKISYKIDHDWYGLAFVDPANDWGKILGGYNISEAKTLSFWAKTNEFNVIAKIGFGLMKDSQSFPDTAIKHQEIKLTKTWKKYTIKTKRLDLSCIRSGLVLFSNGSLFPHEIYIDDVVFEKKKTVILKLKKIIR